MKRLLVILGCLLLAGVIALPVHAQGSPQNTVTISPSFQEVILAEETLEVHYPLSIANTTSALIEFQISAVDLKGLDETGGQFFVGVEAEDLDHLERADWISFSGDRVEVEPGETATVDVIVSNLPTLGPGGHYAALVLKTTNVESVGEFDARVTIQQRLTSLIFTTKQGGEIYDLSLKDVGSSGPFWRLPSSLRLSFFNPGNTHVKPRGIVRLRDPFGRLVAEGTINLESGSVLPEQTRNFIVQLSRRASALVPGPYKAEVDYRYDGLEQTTKLTKTLYYLNLLHFAILVSLGLSLILIWKKGFLKRFKRETKSPK